MASLLYIYFFQIDQPSEFSQNINWLKAHPDIDLPYTRSMLKWSHLDNAKTHTGFDALNHLFRGVDRLMMKRKIDEQRALEDFQAFLNDAQEIGLDNEIVWSIEAYLYLKNEDRDKAIAAFKKLKTSKLLSQKEKKGIDESIEYIKNRKSGKVLNGFYDKYFLSKIATKYMLSVLAQVDWKKIMKENDVPHTDEMFETVDQFQDFLVKLQQYQNTEKLKEVGTEVGQDLKKKGKGLWDNAKDLLKEKTD